MATPAQNLWTVADSAELDGIQLDASDFAAAVVLRKVPHGDAFEAARAGDVERLRYLVEEAGVDVNARDRWDSAALYYACLAGQLDSARLLLESGAICSEHTFDGDRCHYAALNLKIRKLLKSFEARPPPLLPLHAALRDLFLASPPNLPHPIPLSISAGLSPSSASSSNYFPPDIVLIVQGRPIEAHKVILSVRSPFFRKKFETDWKSRREVRFGREKLSYAALYSLIHFFYSDRLEIAVDDMEDLVRICKVCKCESLRRVLEKELVHQKYAEYKALRDVDNSQKRFIFQGTSLPEEDRLPSSLHRILQASLANSKANSPDSEKDRAVEESICRAERMNVSDLQDDLADVCIRVDGKIFRCHQVVLASRSDYFKARLSRMMDFHEGKDGSPVNSLPCIDERDLSTEALEKMVEFMYTDSLKDIDPDQAEEIFDAASRYLLFPLKRAVADVLLPHLEAASLEELCHWLILSDIYGVAKIREHCLDMIASDFETFAESRVFRTMLLTLPPPSGDSTLRTTLPSAPGAELSSDQANLLDDLREKWLEAEAGELDKRDKSALIFDKRLEILMVVAERENSEENSGNRD